VDGHAGESETSAILVIHPELVDKSLLRSDNEGMPLNRLKALTDAGVYTGIWWYADHPTHYCGDGRAGTAEKGERLLAAQAQVLAKAIRLIKEDQVTKRLQDEFYAASEQHGLKPA
jgi:creatinine amidohydrolase